VLEIKTVSGFAANQWEDGIPPAYLIQLQTYLLITEYTYGEIAILKDGRYMSVIPFEAVQEIQEKIISKTKTFWENVQRAREIVSDFADTAEINSFEEFQNASHRLTEWITLAELEPAPDDSKAYEEYLKKRYRIEPKVIEGTDIMLFHVKAYITHSNLVKQHEERKRECSNRIKAFMKDSDTIDFGVNGIVTHKEDSRGARRLNIKLKGE